jgi:hypothetical protein
VLKAVLEVAQTSRSTYYFSIYYTGIALAENGNWIFPKAKQPKSKSNMLSDSGWWQDFDTVTMHDILLATKKAHFNG